MKKEWVNANDELSSWKDGLTLLQKPIETIVAAVANDELLSKVGFLNVISLVINFR